MEHFSIVIADLTELPSHHQVELLREIYPCLRINLFRPMPRAGRGSVQWVSNTA